MFKTKPIGAGAIRTSLKQQKVRYRYDHLRYRYKISHQLAPLRTAIFLSFTLNILNLINDEFSTAQPKAMRRSS